jgi:hypothetical protein
MLPLPITAILMPASNQRDADLIPLSLPGGRVVPRHDGLCHAA